MKKHILITLIVFLPKYLLGQSIFQKYHNNKEVTYVSISPKIFQLLGSMSLSNSDPEANELLEMINGIKSFKALITGIDSISDEINQWVKSEATLRGLDLKVSMQKSDMDLIVYVKEGQVEGEFESLLMFSKGVSRVIPEVQTKSKNIEALVLLIEGKIESDKIVKLIEKMDLPGGDQLKMAGI